MTGTRRFAAAIATSALLAACGPPPNAAFDYQIGEDYPLPTGVEVVSRDWFGGTALSDGYSICYVNAFQTQDDEAGVDRPDERSNWPQNLVLDELGDDPNWGGEYLIDISTPARRTQALAWLAPMIDACAAKGFNAVEFDNLDSWTRFDGTPLAGQVPFDQADAQAFATMLSTYAHEKLLASGHKNTTDLLDQAETIGFDFAVVEECGDTGECLDFTAIYERVVAIEYTDAGFATACAEIGAVASVVRRDVNVTAPGSATYVYDEC